MKADKENWVNNVIESINGIQRAEAGNGLYNRVLSRIEQNNIQNASVYISGNYVLRVAAGLFVVVALNAITWYTFSTQNNNKQTQLKAFAREYSISDNSLTD